MSEGNLYILPYQMNRRIKRLVLHFLAQKIEQTILGTEFLAVEDDRQRRIQIRIVPAHLLDEGVFEFRLGGENRAIDLEGQTRAIFPVFATRVFHVDREGTLRELECFGLTIAPRLDFEKIRERVDRFDADAIKADRFLECLAVVLGAGVDLRRAVEKLSKRNAAPEVAHLDPALLVDVDADLLAEAHDVLVDRVVDGFLEQDVKPVIGR